jgi:hypothetical protein
MAFGGLDTGHRDFKTGLANKAMDQTPRRAALASLPAPVTAGR